MWKPLEFNFIKFITFHSLIHIIIQLGSGVYSTVELSVCQIDHFVTQQPLYKMINIYVDCRCYINDI